MKNDKAKQSKKESIKAGLLTYNCILQSFSFERLHCSSYQTLCLTPALSWNASRYLLPIYWIIFSLFITKEGKDLHLLHLTLNACYLTIMRTSQVEHFQNIYRAPFWSLSRANVRMSFPSSQCLLVFQYGDLGKQKDPGGMPQQLIGWRRGIGCECEKTDVILCVYWGLRVHIISFTSRKIGTFEQMCHIIKSNIVRG